MSAEEGRVRRGATNGTLGAMQRAEKQREEKWRTWTHAALIGIGKSTVGEECKAAALLNAKKPVCAWRRGLEE